MTGRGHAHIVGIALEWTVVAHGDIAESRPTRQRLLEFKRAVLHHFGIQTAVGAIIYILKKYAVHCRRHFGAALAGIEYCRFSRCCQRGSGKE